MEILLPARRPMSHKNVLTLALIAFGLAAHLTAADSPKAAPVFPELAKYRGKVVLLNFSQKLSSTTLPLCLANSGNTGAAFGESAAVRCAARPKAMRASVRTFLCDMGLLAGSRISITCLA